MKDMIYRDDAIALVIKAIHGTDNKEIQNYLFDGLRKQMWSLPSADAVQGEWIKKRVDGRGIHHGFCSKCGFNVKRNYNYNYCPNCGKKMKIVERR